MINRLKRSMASSE